MLSAQSPNLNIAEFSNHRLNLRSRKNNPFQKNQLYKFICLTRRKLRVSGKKENLIGIFPPLALRLPKYA